MLRKREAAKLVLKNNCGRAYARVLARSIPIRAFGVLNLCTRLQRFIQYPPAIHRQVDTMLLLTCEASLARTSFKRAYSAAIPSLKTSSPQKARNAEMEHQNQIASVHFEAMNCRVHLKTLSLCLCPMRSSPPHRASSIACRRRRARCSTRATPSRTRTRTRRSSEASTSR